MNLLMMLSMLSLGPSNGLFIFHGSHQEPTGHEAPEVQAVQASHHGFSRLRGENLAKNLGKELDPKWSPEVKTATPLLM